MNILTTSGSYNINGISSSFATNSLILDFNGSGEYITVDIREISNPSVVKFKGLLYDKIINPAIGGGYSSVDEFVAAYALLIYSYNTNNIGEPVEILHSYSIAGLFINGTSAQSFTFETDPSGHSDYSGAPSTDYYKLTFRILDTKTVGGNDSIEEYIDNVEYSQLASYGFTSINIYGWKPGNGDRPTYAQDWNRISMDDPTEDSFIKMPVNYLSSNISYEEDTGTNSANGKPAISIRSNDGTWKTFYPNYNKNTYHQSTVGGYRLNLDASNGNRDYETSGSTKSYILDTYRTYNYYYDTNPEESFSYRTSVSNKLLSQTKITPVYPSNWTSLPQINCEIVTSTRVKITVTGGSLNVSSVSHSGLDIRVYFDAQYGGEVYCGVYPVYLSPN